MTKVKPKLIPYENTLYDILIDNIRGKYFQNLRAPHLIAQIPEENNLRINYLEDQKLSVWFPLSEKWGNISLDEFSRYAQISEEQFKEYQKNPVDPLGYLLVHKDSTIFKENNKANLSADKGFGIIVDKSKAKKTTNMNITPFPKDSMFNH